MDSTLTYKSVNAANGRILATANASTAAGAGGTCRAFVPSGGNHCGNQTGLKNFLNVEFRAAQIAKAAPLGE